MPGTKLLERRVAAHLEIEMNVDARLPQPRDPPRDDILFKLEAGNAIGHQAARALMPVIHMDVVAFDSEQFSGREPCGACTNNANRLSRALGAALHRLDPAFLPRSEEGPDGKEGGSTSRI